MQGDEYSTQWRKQLHKVLCGRRLLQSEMECPTEVLKQGEREGLLKQLPGIERRSRKYFCNGCGNMNQGLFGAHACYQCRNELCYYCRNCISTRKISSCTPLYIWANEYEAPRNTIFLPQTRNSLNWQGQLTPAQAKASQIMIQQIQEKKDCLVHAVTGAGKTEMMFQPIAYAHACGKKVCFASPRTDVILELAPRLKSVFPQLDIGVYYADSDEKNPHAELILATTHQLMRFHQRFDVLILDESDAFPYKRNSALKFSLHQALKRNHSLIYCTATPDPMLSKELQLKNVKTIFVSCRFHGRPLEIPEWVWVGGWQKKLAQHAKVSNQLIRKLEERLNMGRQVFVFVPYINIAKQLYMVFARLSIKSDYVYAEDSQRKEKVEAFRSKKIDVLVTTTILERGVTIPFVDVFVFGSESRIFDAAALVQICGRAGRHIGDEMAKIYFFQCAQHGRNL